MLNAANAYIGHLLFSAHIPLVKELNRVIFPAIASVGGTACDVKKYQAANHDKAQPLAVDNHTTESKLVEFDSSRSDKKIHAIAKIQYPAVANRMKRARGLFVT
ncbi:hypothetical protein A1342_14705 [Methylomonas methanica]|uniref:Uncharacterized protein n=1 Tax=Methylomonas denitrificans TaxID=1538553 RepID=A0A126T106_9GAMM|nr:hypothetical protein [Methylomonas methanica]AMK75765.1 hypothetical protein JT25_004570 [Methylomonas denitrificans]OAH98243.1 hypothetical protein A1342_14705 [Methylomonas methanica]